MILIFDLSNNLVMASSDAPSSHEGDDYIRVVYADYDPAYSYSLVDGVAVKGDLIPIDSDEIARLDAEYETIKYQRDRKSEYPAIEDQLDKIYHEGIDAWKVDIKAVKDKYPKG